MEANSSASESDALRLFPSSETRRVPSARAGFAISSRFACIRNGGFPSPRALIPICVFCLALLASCVSARGDALAKIRNSGQLRYGSDMEGGGPYAYPDPRSPRDVTGFEVELMASLATRLGANPEFSQGQWDKLLQLLDSGRIDLVCNGYEWTETRTATTWRHGRTMFINSS